MQLVKYEAARHALQVATSVDEVKDIRDKAEAMAAYARQANDVELIQWATELKVRAERKAGEMLAAMPKHKGGQPKKNQSNDTTSTLKDIGISKDQSSRWQKLAAVPQDKFEKAVDAAKEIAKEVTTAGLQRAIKGENIIATRYTGDEEWYTPGKYIVSARIVMGGITTDPASNEFAQEQIKADVYHTIEDNGLTQDWKGKVWMNPPYTALVINRFIDKLILHYVKGDVTEAIVLTNSSTDTSWCQNCLNSAAAVCFTAGRISFIKENEEKSSPTCGQAFFYFGEDPLIFKDEFSQYGKVLVI